jgi:hypothetical protein
MRKSRFLPLFFAILVGLIALALLVAAFLPYGTLKALADALKSNGNFKSLKESNALVFKLLLGFGGLVLLGAAGLVGSGHLNDFLAWLTRLWEDIPRFFQDLKPVKIQPATTAALGLILVVGFILRIRDINGYMTHDESYTFVVYASTSLFNIVTNYQLPNNHVLNSLLIFLSTHLFGIQPWVIRLPALLAGLLTILASYALAKAIYDRYTGLLAALIVAVLPGAVVYSSSGRGYSLVALFTLLSLWLADYVRRHKNLFAWSLLVFFSALGFYAVPVMLFPFGMVFVWLVLETLVAASPPYASKIDFLKHWLVAGFSTALLVLLLYTPIFIFTGADKVFANSWVLPQSWNGYFASLPSSAFAIWSYWTGAIPPMLSILALAGFVLGLIFYRRIARQRFPLAGAALIWFASFLILRRPQMMDKVWVFLQAPLAIWISAGITGPLRDVRLKWLRSLPLAAVLVSLAMILPLINVIRLLPSLPKEWATKSPVENTVLWVKGRLQTGDLIIIDAPYDAQFWYYSRLYAVASKRFDQRLPFQRLFVIVSPTYQQTVDSVLHDRGPDLTQVNESSARLVLNFGNLNTYEVLHR